MVEVSEIGNHPLVKSLLASLNGEVRSHISSTIDALEKALATVERWKGGEIDNINGRETNKEHVLGMLDLILENFDLFSKICDIEELIIAVLIHDMGEFRIGDIPQSMKGSEELKKKTKKYEKMIAFTMIGKITDKELKEKVKLIMNRCLNLKLNGNVQDIDITILLLKVLDIVQAFNYGLNNVFPDNLEKFPEKKDEITKHMLSRLEIIAGLFLLLELRVASINLLLGNEIKILLDKIIKHFRIKVEDLNGEKIKTFPEMYSDGLQYLLGRYN